jgi:hypothetical protein
MAEKSVIELSAAVGLADGAVLLYLASTLALAVHEHQ